MELTSIIKKRIERIFSGYRITYRKFITSDEAFYVDMLDPISNREEVCTLYLVPKGAVLSIPTRAGSLEIRIGKGDYE